MKNFEVMVTENFKAKQIKTPKIGGLGIKVENDLLSIDLSKLDIDTKYQIEMIDLLLENNNKELEDTMKNSALSDDYKRKQSAEIMESNNDLLSKKLELKN